MSTGTTIEWTNATWNPVTGCVEVSEGCDNCYARRFAERWRGIPGHPFEQGFDVRLWPERLEMPLRWRTPRRVFVNSMSDLFLDAVPDDFVARVFAVMAAAASHTFQVLTKRPGRMRSLLNNNQFREDVCHHRTGLLPTGPATERTPPAEVWPLPNVWLGVSVESQKWANIRLPLLAATPAAVRFASCEPLLDELDIRRWLPTGLDWVIAGGESGPTHDPWHQPGHDPSATNANTQASPTSSNNGADTHPKPADESSTDRHGLSSHRRRHVHL